MDSVVGPDVALMGPKKVASEPTSNVLFSVTFEARVNDEAVVLRCLMVHGAEGSPTVRLPAMDA